jgi:3-mercaptopyruvate sulfurtransferase SseA
VALELKRHGLTRVRPLYGGLSSWMENDFPTEELKLPSRQTAS